MKTPTVKIILYCAICLFTVSVVLLILPVGKFKKTDYSEMKPIAYITDIKSMNNGSKWTRSFLSSGGIIYLKDHMMSRDGGNTLIEQNDIDLEEINRQPERAVLVNKNLFYALDGPTVFVNSGVYRGKAWRSADNLKTLQQEEPVFYIPNGIKPRKDVEKWFGIFVYRTIMNCSDGSWLITMYGNFEADTITPLDKDAIEETQFMMRTIIMTSNDEGHTWKYLSTVAAPEAGEPVGEGFVEPAITLLKDGRLLCIMRTGHHYPLYASWSSDMGKTWTFPQYTGLDRGCDPCLITLHDGRVALSWGRRFPESWSEISPKGDKGRFNYPGEGYTSLSISNDGGSTWENSKIILKSGSCYSTIFEVEPGTIFMQSDQLYCRIGINPL